MNRLIVTMRILKVFLTAISLLVAVSMNTAREVEQQKADGTLRRLRVPILMYHYVGDLPPGADQIRVGLTVSSQRFREHLELLRMQGYQTVALHDVFLALTQGTPLPPNPIVLSFDDGYIDHLQNVMPALQEFGYIGTFFVITTTADHHHAGYLNWAQIEQMAAAGMEIAAHTKTHPDLRDRPHDFLVYEVLGSVESIQVNIGTESVTFAYPMGRYDDATVEMLRQAGVTAAVTTEHGATHTTDRVLEMKRLRIQNTTGVAGLEALLREK